MFNKMAIQLCFDGTGTTYDFWVSTSPLFLTVSTKKVIILMSDLSETRTYLMNKKCCPVNCESVEENREENQIF